MRRYCEITGTRLRYTKVGELWRAELTHGAVPVNYCPVGKVKKNSKLTIYGEGNTKDDARLALQMNVRDHVLQRNDGANWGVPYFWGEEEGSD